MMEVSNKIRKFILNNLDLINKGDGESWELLYSKLNSKGNSNPLVGMFTQIILESGIKDPVESLKYIPRNYLMNGNIKNYNIPDNCLFIDKFAFYNSNLQKIIIPNSVVQISQEAFRECVELSEVSIGKHCTAIGTSAFSGCLNLQNIIIPDSVKTIGEYCFEWCTNLKEVTLSKEIIKIPHRSFYKTNLISIDIPKNVEIIESDAFASCNFLQHVKLSKSIKYIYESAFRFCTSLEDIVYEGTSSEWASIRKEHDWEYKSKSFKVICKDKIIFYESTN